MAKKVELKALASNPLSGFKHKKVTVPEWENAEVIVREPSAGAWLAWQEKSEALKNGAETLTLAEKAQLQLEADVVLFMSVFCDEEGAPVFPAEDQQAVLGFYGPIHARLVRQALDLLTPAADIEAK